MTRKSDSAYPIQFNYPNGERKFAAGLTKRETFAAMAMQGLLSGNASYKGKEDAEALTRDAVRHADALVEALNQKDESSE